MKNPIIPAMICLSTIAASLPAVAAPGDLGKSTAHAPQTIQSDAPIKVVRWKIM